MTVEKSDEFAGYFVYLHRAEATSKSEDHKIILRNSQFLSGLSLTYTEEILPHRVAGVYVLLRFLEIFSGVGKPQKYILHISFKSPVGQSRKSVLFVQIAQFSLHVSGYKNREADIAPRAYDHVGFELFHYFKRLKHAFGDFSAGLGYFCHSDMIQPSCVYQFHGISASWDHVFFYPLAASYIKDLRGWVHLF